jgi:tRNA G18 (ribose-2'-O)-methylase SpoU
MPYFEVGIYHTKSVENVGTLWRTAYQLGAAGLFTIGARYKHHPSDPFRTMRHIPLRNYQHFEQFLEHRPVNAILVAVEEGGIPLSEFDHPPQAIYLLGAEDYGLPGPIIQKCNITVSLESVIRPSYNVAVAGSIVLYDRIFGKK